MEKVSLRLSRILQTIGWITLALFALFTIEIAFIFSALSMIMWLDQTGGDPSVVLVFTKAHFYLMRFAMIMFFFSAVAWMVYWVSKSNRENREKHEQRRQETIQQIKQEILAELKKSRRLR